MSSDYKARNVNSTHSITLRPSGDGNLQINNDATAFGAVSNSQTSEGGVTPVSATNGSTHINCTVQIKDTTNIGGGFPVAMTTQEDGQPVGSVAFDDGDTVDIIPQPSGEQWNDMLVRIVAEWNDIIETNAPQGTLANCPIKNIFLKLTV